MKTYFSLRAGEAEYRLRLTMAGQRALREKWGEDILTFLLSAAADGDRLCDLLGEALRLAEGLERQPEALAAFAEEELAPLFRHCPTGMLTMPEGEELERLLDEARYLCLDMLEGK